MIIEKFVLSAFQQNTRVVACSKTREAICIDPGAASAEIVAFLNIERLQLKAITLTHGHLDHVGGVSYLRDAFPDSEVLLHADDEALYHGLPTQPLFMGIPQQQLSALGLEFATPPKLSRNWLHGEVFSVGELNFEVRHSPGHTRGHVVLAELSHKKVFVGDCLFLGSIGRSDLPGGDHDQLISSIMNNIIELGDDFIVYSGHGPETTVGNERLNNPFLNGMYSQVRGRYV